jgi:hypothetical protein
MNKHALLPTFIVFLMPFLGDLIIFGGSGQMDQALRAPAILIGNATFAAIPFLLIGSAMKPRTRVTRALWIVAILTVLLWLAYAWSGWKYQVTKTDGAINIGIGMWLMVWPFICVILMGIIAKFGEPERVSDTLNRNEG